MRFCWIFLAFTRTFLGITMYKRSLSASRVCLLSKNEEQQKKNVYQNEQIETAI